ncbi:hypothetical protein NQ314_007836, partial [Rhamnusium bicolor]
EHGLLKVTNNLSDIYFQGDNDNPECVVCLQPCVYPVELPCGHIFCFLCVKGYAHQNKKCAICRQDIPQDFMKKPNLLWQPLQQTAQGLGEGYHWFYEGRNGWWKYDERTNEDIEQAYKLDLKNFEILICGELYIIDFENKYQYPKKIPNRRRSIIRQNKINNIIVKGVAGLRHL